MKKGNINNPTVPVLIRIRQNQKTYIKNNNISLSKFVRREIMRDMVKKRKNHSKEIKITMKKLIKGVQKTNGARVSN